MRSLLALSLSALLLTGCTVGPDYKRPTASVPTSYRGPVAGEPSTQASSLAEQKWFEVFRDEQLQSLIRTALQQNYDVRIAAQRILQAEAQLGITRADQFPTVAAGAGLSAQRTPKSAVLPPLQQSTGQLTLSAAWQLDFWGRYRRATESARA